MHFSSRNLKYAGLLATWVVATSAIIIIESPHHRSVHVHGEPLQFISYDLPVERVQFEQLANDVVLTSLDTNVTKTIASLGSEDGVFYDFVSDETVNRSFPRLQRNVTASQNLRYDWTYPFVLPVGQYRLQYWSSISVFAYDYTTAAAFENKWGERRWYSSSNGPQYEQVVTASVDFEVKGQSKSIENASLLLLFIIIVGLFVGSSTLLWKFWKKKFRKMTDTPVVEVKSVV